MSNRHRMDKMKRGGFGCSENARDTIEHKMLKVASMGQPIFGILFLMGKRNRRVKWKANVGALDVDSPQPAIKITLPNED